MGIIVKGFEKVKRFTIPAVIAVAMVLFVAQTALASGFFVARFGGGTWASHNGQSDGYVL